jgi:DNA polymerase-3 subunit alpha
MQIAREMASYTLGGADMLRRAMGKKKPEEMAKQRATFVEGAIKNNVDEKIATYVFDLMEKFAGYGFNKSHSAAYALVAYQTAWLKTHYPAAFMAAVLSSDMDNTDKVVTLIEECREMRLKICPPDINMSNYRFTVNSQGQIVYGLGAIKGVGESAIDEILQNRAGQGTFSGLYDLCKRVDLRKVNRRVLEALCRAGALDSFDPNRAAHLAELPTALKVAEQHGKMMDTGQDDLFGLGEGLVAEQAETQGYQNFVEPWPEQEKLANEKITLGLFLSGHPIEQYENELKFITSGTIAQLKAEAERAKGRMEAKVSGLIVELRTRQTKQGKTMGFATIDDRTARMEIAAYSEAYEKYRSILAKDSLIVAEGALSIDDFSGGLRLTVDSVYDIEQARSNYARELQLRWHADDGAPGFVGELQSSLMPFKGGTCAVGINYISGEASASLQLGDDWRVHPTDELISRLKRLPGIAQVDIRYR